jgi:hypothetical protein
MTAKWVCHREHPHTANGGDTLGHSTTREREIIMTDTIHGRCLCGAVRYRVTPPTLFCGHCHCRYCRRPHGAAIVTRIGAAETAFELTAGDEHLRWHASSKQSRRGFCSVCGTTLFFASTLDPGEIHIALATAEGPIDRDPGVHVFVDHQVPWIELGDELPRFSGDDERLARYREIDP